MEIVITLQSGLARMGATLYRECTGMLNLESKIEARFPHWFAGLSLARLRAPWLSLTRLSRIEAIHRFRHSAHLAGFCID